MTKKILSLALAAVMALGLMACGSQSSGSAGGNASGGASASQSGAPSSSADASTSSDAGASGESAPETVTITALDGSGQEIELEVPYNPQRIAILDMACLDILDALGVGDRVVGTASTSLEYLQPYVNDYHLQPGHHQGGRPGGRDGLRTRCDLHRRPAVRQL